MMAPDNNKLPAVMLPVDTVKLVPVMAAPVIAPVALTTPPVVILPPVTLPVTLIPGVTPENTVVPPDGLVNINAVALALN